MPEYGDGWGAGARPDGGGRDGAPAGTTRPGGLEVGGGDGGAPARTANGSIRASRAAQFMPFAALTGYYELARKQERIVEPRHELTEEEALELSRTMAQLKRGDLVRVTYYDYDAYRTVMGVIARLDTAYRRLQVVKTVIAFDDILKITRDARPGANGSALQTRQVR